MANKVDISAIVGAHYLHSLTHQGTSSINIVSFLIYTDLFLDRLTSVVLFECINLPPFCRKLVDADCNFLVYIFQMDNI